MRTLSIAEIQSMEHGEIVPSFSGLVSKVYEQKRGTSEHGDWQLQNFIVTYGESEITVTHGDEDDYSSMEGKRYTFESTETKHGLQGIKRDIRTVNGKRYEGVKLTGSCKIKLLSGEQSDEAPSRGAISEPNHKAVPAQNPIAQHAAHARQVFQKAWSEAGEVMKTPLLPEKDAQDMELGDYYDIKLRIAQFIAIQTQRSL